MSLPISKALKYIHRYNNPISCKYGWEVCLPKKEKTDKKKTKFFSDGKNGGTQNALKAAKDYRDKKLQEMGIDITTVGPCNVYRSDNSSGIPGIQLKNGRWCADITTKWLGRTRRSFMVNKYGNKTAFLEACRARYEAHGTLHIHCKMSELPCRPDVPYIKVKKS